MIRQNVNLQARLIDDLLDVMRIVRGKMPLHWEVADCHRLIDQAVQICRSEVLGKRAPPGRGPGGRPHRHVNADPARLQQVFWNLIKNAVKFTPEGGSITVRTRNEDGRRTGTASSSRSPTPASASSRRSCPTIFDPFQQGETTITRKFGGLGLGLAICKGIVEAHGGDARRRERGQGPGDDVPGRAQGPARARRSRADGRAGRRRPTAADRRRPRRSASWSWRTSRRPCG